MDGLYLVALVAYYSTVIVSLFGIMHFRRWGWLGLLVMEGISFFWAVGSTIYYLDIIPFHLAETLEYAIPKLVEIGIIVYGWLEWKKYPLPQVPFSDRKLFESQYNDILDTNTATDTMTRVHFLRDILKVEKAYTIIIIVSFCYWVFCLLLLGHGWLMPIVALGYPVALIMFAWRFWQAWIPFAVLYTYFLWQNIKFAIEFFEYNDILVYVSIMWVMAMLGIIIYGLVYWYRYWKNQMR